MTSLGSWKCRKFDSGMHAWEARPGEHYMATTGQKGGPWKSLGRPPQKLVGIGFIAEGFGDEPVLSPHAR